ncbi:MAG: DUF126 domain-containing protein [Hyphomicrobiales bacterium]
MTSIAATVLSPGTASGPILKLEEPLSFWGAYDTATGAIIDLHHPQRGTVLTGAILVMHESRGSGTAPGSIAESIRRGTAPAAIVLVRPDINLAVGSTVAARLYGKRCPVVTVSEAEFERLGRAKCACIAEDGTIIVD